MHTTVAGDTLPATGEDRPIGPGAMIGRYRIERRIGAGGMGVVYVAFDPELARNVAVKLLRERGDDDTADRLRREARALAALSHPNVVAVHDVGEHAGQLFIAMEYVDGGSLRDWLAGGRRPWREVLRLAIAAGRGVEAAHAAGLVHRDIKPDNLLVGRDGRVRVTDFGIVASANRTTDGDVQLTMPGALVGTPAYMAPEQLTGSADARSDQFSLCATVFEALFGVRPFVGNSIEVILANILEGGVVTTRADAAPRWLRAAIVRGLAAKPEDRWPSVGALCDAIERRANRPRRWLIASGLAAAAIGGSAIAWAALPAAPPPPCATPIPVNAPWLPARVAKLAEILPVGAAERAEHWLTRWSAAVADVCISDASDAVIRERRASCLTDQLGAIDYQLREWEARKQEPLLIEAGLMSLPGAWRCSRVALVNAPERPIAVQLPMIFAVRRDVLVAKVKLPKEPPAALATIEPIVVRARATGYPPLVVETLTELGTAELQSRHASSAEQLLQEAAAIAEANHDDIASADASVPLVKSIGMRRPEQALELGERALPVIRKLGAVDLEASLEANLGEIWTAIERPSEAVGAYRQAIARCRDAFGTDSLCEGTVQMRLVGVLEKVNAPKSDIAAATDHVTRTFRRLGMPSTPAGFASAPRDKIEPLKALIATAQRIHPDSLDVAEGESALAATYALADEHDLAYEHFRRAIAIRDNVGVHDAKLVFLLSQAAVTRLDASRPRDALPLVKRAVALGRAGESKTELAYALMVDGRTLIEAADPEAARAPLREALALYDELHAESWFRGRTRFLLATALWAGRDGDRHTAVELARAARVDLDAAVAASTSAEVRARRAQRLAETERWLREHQ